MGVTLYLKVGGSDGGLVPSFVKFSVLFCASYLSVVKETVIFLITAIMTV